MVHDLVDKKCRTLFNIWLVSSCSKQARVRHCCFIFVSSSICWSCRISNSCKIRQIVICFPIQCTSYVYFIDSHIFKIAFSKARRPKDPYKFVFVQVVVPLLSMSRLQVVSGPGVRRVFFFVSYIERSLVFRRCWISHRRLESNKTIHVEFRTKHGMWVMLSR